VVRPDRRIVEADMKLAIIDTNNIAHRYFYTLDLKNGEGRDTGVIYGITKLLISICKKSKPDAIIFVFDYLPPNPSPSGKNPPEFYHQLWAIIKMLEILKVNYIIAEEGIIADYYIGSIVNWMRGHAPHILIDIYSNDHDFFQLIDGNVRVVKSGKMEEIIDLQKIREKYNLEPSQLTDLWALTGDQGDNIPGVAGIGQVRGMKLIQEYQDLLGALAYLETQSKYSGCTQSAWEAYNLINLRDKNISFRDRFPMSCKHLYNKDFWKAPLRVFFEEFSFYSLIQSLEQGSLF
jgi:DNA polymerase-1